MSFVTLNYMYFNLWIGKFNWLAKVKEKPDNIINNNWNTPETRFSSKRQRQELKSSKINPIWNADTKKWKFIKKESSNAFFSWFGKNCDMNHHETHSQDMIR